MQALLDWLAAGGARVDGVEVRAVDGLRGVVAARPLAEGTVVVSVPRPLMITKEQVRASSIGRQLRDANLELSSSHAVLAAWLATERRSPRSPYHAYFDVLPRDFGDFPYHAPPAERALLDGTLTGAMLAELRDDLDDDLAQLAARVRLFRGVERDELIWARLCIGSRTFAVTIDGIETTALVPFADLLNHRNGRHTRWGYDQAAEAFTITTLRDFAAGEEVCDSYGAKPNCRYLVQYGFCVDDNPDDEAELLGYRAPRDPTAAAARPMLDELRKRYAAGGDAALWAALAEGARAALAWLPHRLADDDALLAGPLTARARAFVHARRGEKLVLQAWLDHATAQSSAR